MSLPSLTRLSLLSGNIAGNAAKEEQTDLPPDVAEIIAGLAAKEPLKGHYINATAFLAPRIRRHARFNSYILRFELRTDLGENDGIPDYGDAWKKRVEAVAKQAEVDRREAAERLGIPDLQGDAPGGCTELECLIKTAFHELDGGNYFGAPGEDGELVVSSQGILYDWLEVELHVEFKSDESTDEGVLRTGSEKYHTNVLILGTKAVVSVLVKLLNLIPHPNKKHGFTEKDLVLDMDSKVIREGTFDEVFMLGQYALEVVVPGRMITAPLCFGTEGCGKPLKHSISEQLHAARWQAGEYGSRGKPSKEQRGGRS